MTAFSKPERLSPQLSTSTTFEGELGVSTYSPFFCAAISAEAKALQEECNEHDLYQVQLQRASPDPRLSTSYLLHVPGLRETSLRVEVGDVVHIREIRVTKAGKVKQVSLQDANGRSLPHAITKRNDSVVWHIDRLRETITLRVDSLHQSSKFFNARFTVQSDRIDALQRAVTGAQQHMNSSGNDWMRSM